MPRFGRALGDPSPPASMDGDADDEQQPPGPSQDQLPDTVADETQQPSPDGLQQQQQQPPDPEQPLRDLMDYTTRTVRSILHSEDRERFLANIRSKVSMRTMYSGLGSEGIAMQWIIKALESEGVLEQDQGLFTWHSACDLSPLARRFLLACPDGAGPSHVFVDILDRHNPETRQQLDHVRWAAGSSKKRGACAMSSTDTQAAIYIYIYLRRQTSS